MFHGSFLVQGCGTSHNGFNFPVGAEATHERRSFKLQWIHWAS
jgi:hypothetical protein